MMDITHVKCTEIRLEVKSNPQIICYFSVMAWTSMWNLFIYLTFITV